MQRFAKIFLILTIVLLLLWLLPWNYQFVTAKSNKVPFTLYSNVINDFVMLNNSGQKEISYSDLSGNSYTEKQFDSILPFFYYRQLMAEERLPDSLHGIPVSPRIIQTENFIFRTLPSTVNATQIPLYFLLESMSGRVDLNMPDDVFRINDRMEFIDIGTNSIKEQKSRLFTDMLLKKDFTFPANIIAGNPTARKEYDEGYLIVDAENNLFHVKQVKGKPYVRFIKIPAGIEIKHIFVTEFKNQKSLAFLIDTQFRFWVLSTKSYEFHQIEIPAFDPTQMSMSIIANMFDWTITVVDGKKEALYAIDANNYRLLKSMERPISEPGTAQKTGKYIFPVRLEFSSNLYPQIYPRIKFIFDDK